MKCVIDLNALKKIRNRATMLVEDYYQDDSATPDTLEQATKELINFVKNEYELTPENVSSVSDYIYKGIHDKGGLDEDRSFFNKQSYTSLLDYVQKGGVLNLAAAANPMTEQDVKSKDFITPSEFLSAAYGSAYDVQRQAELQVKTSLVDAFFINRGSIIGADTGAVSSEHLNRNIRLYQQQLINKVCEYLRTKRAELPDDIVQIIEDPVLYTEAGEYTGIYTDLKPYIKKYLGTNRIGDKRLRQLQQESNHNEESKLKLDAYNAFVFFDNFDQYINDIFPKAIIIKSTEFGKKAVSDDKYKIGDKSTGQSNTTHRKSEEISESELDAVTRMYIETSPIYNWNGSTPTGQYLTFGHYQNILGKIKALGIRPEVRAIVFDDSFELNREIWGSLSPQTKEFLSQQIDGKPMNLGQAINIIRHNPRQYTHSVFELLSNDAFRQKYPQVYELFEGTELDHIYSSYKALYDPESGLRSLVRADSEIDYYHYVVQTSNSVFSNNFIQYTIDENKNLVQRSAIDQSRNRRRRKLVNTINATAHKNLRNTLDIYNLDRNVHVDNVTGRNVSTITFTIPNTDIEVSVTLDQFGNQANTTFLQNGESINSKDLITNPDILQFIDEVLGLDLQNNSDFINTMDKNDPAFALRKLMWLSSNVLANTYVFDKELDGLSKSEMIERASSLYNGREFNYLKTGVRSLDLIPKSNFAEAVVQSIISTQMALEGITTSTLVKDSQGASQNKLALSKLLGSYPSQWDLQERRAESATNHLSILTVPGLFKEGSFSTTEYYDGANSDQKKATKFIVAEQAYSAIMANYVPALMRNPLERSTVRNGIATFLASVNSDKNTINQLPFDLNVEIDVNGRSVKILDMTDQDLKWVMSKDFGQMNLKILSNISSDFDRLHQFILNTYTDCPKINPVDFSEFNAWCLRNRLGNPEQFLKDRCLEYNQQNRLNPIQLTQDLYYRVENGNLIPNVLLLSQIARFAPRSAQNLGINLNEYYTYDEFFREKEKEIVYSLMKSNTQFDLLTPDEGTDNQVKRFIKEDIPDWVSPSDKMIIAKVVINGIPYDICSKYDIDKIAQRARINTKEVYNYITEINPYLKRYNLLDYWLTQQWMATTVGSFIDHPGGKVFKNAKPYFQAKNQAIEQINGINERVNQINSQVQALNALAQLDPNQLIEIEKLNQELAALKNQEATLQQVIVSSNKEIALLWEAAAYQDQHKRNVQFTAQMYEFTANLLSGPPLRYRFATIQSITDFATILEEANCKMKPNDGATFVNGVINYLENEALGGNKAGVDKKQFIHFKNERTGTSGVDKTAGYAVTNDRIRRSPNGWGNMNYQMMHHRWMNEDGSVINPNDVDLLTSYRGVPIIYKDMYFAKNGQQYVIKDIIRRQLTPEEVVLRQKKVGEYGLNPLEPIMGYERVVYRVTPTGSETEQVSAQELESLGIESISILGTNHDVWEFFGGAYSLKQNASGQLRPSEGSFENLVLAVNNIGTIKENPYTGQQYEDDRIESQEQVWQFMKHADIHYMPDGGSMKHGVANVNSSSKYLTKEPLDFQMVTMYQAGIQLDKEHHADDSEVSLPTQIVSACASLGFTIDIATELYNALANASDLGIQELFNAAQVSYNEGDVTKLRESVFKLVAENLADAKDTGSFAAIIAKSIVQRVREGSKNEKYGEGLNKLPLSDRTVMAKMISTISSYINSQSIKLKLPGVLAVISPVHNLYKIHGDRTYDSFTNPEQEIEALQEDYKNNPIYEATVEEVPTSTTTNLEALNRIERQHYEYNNRYLTIASAILQAFKSYNGNNAISYSQSVIDQFNELENRILEKGKDFTEQDLQEVINFVPKLRGKNNIAQWEAYSALTDDVKYSKGYAINYANQFFDNLQQKVLENQVEHTESVSTVSTNRVHDIKLGRKYVIEYSDGSSKTKLINSPKDLRNLEAELGQNTITKVYEYIKDGRNLGAYNVVFEGTDENGNKVNHQLWQLDSVYYIHELKENTNNDEDFRLWYQATFGTSTNLTRNQAIVLFSKRVQQDIANLSKTTEDKVEKLNQLVSAINNSKTAEEQEYNRNNINKWLSVELSSSELGYISQQTAGLSPQEKQTRTYQIVRELLTKKQSVKINGKTILPNKQTIQIDAYELIMPKIFLNQFGFEEFTDLNEVKNDRDYFVKQLIRNRNLNNGQPKPNENQYDIALLSSNGSHIFLLTEDHLPSSNLKESADEILIKEINGKQIRVDFEGNALYEMPKGGKIYVDSRGNEIIVVPNDLDIIDRCVAAMPFDTLDFSQNLSNYGDFAQQLAEKLSENKKRFVREFFEESILNEQDLDSTKILTKFRDAYVYGLTEQNYKDPEFAGKIKHLLKAGYRKHTSFLKSLDVVAGRIPSQSLQSFMPMKVVAYENPNRNSAYVSNLQLLLQGSDLDIDAVTLLTFDINDRGLLELWSPYTNIEQVELAEASMELPFPTGKELQFTETENLDDVVEMIRDFRDVINFNRNEFYFRTHTPYHIRKLGKKLSRKEFFIPSKSKMAELVLRLEEVAPWTNIHSIDDANKFFFGVEKTKKVDGKEITYRTGGIKPLVDFHNLYLNDRPDHFNKRVLNNYIVNAMYKVSADPANQRQAQAPVDAITGPLKEIANASDSAKDVFTRTPGSFVNKAESIDDNAQGKDCIGISAVGIKSYFALTQYANTVLNRGTKEDQQRLLGNLSFPLLQGRTGDSKTLLANIRAKDINTVTNDEVLNLLLSIKTDEDQALVLSALLSLATDNAKELSLANLNAGSTMIGTYIYGICIGMNFQDISRILMSKTAKTLKEVMDSNIMTDDAGYSKLIDSFKYFETIPYKFFAKYDTHITDFNTLQRAYDNKQVKSYDTPYRIFTDFLRDTYKINVYKKEATLKRLATDPDVFNKLDDLRKQAPNLLFGEDIKLFNQLIDFAEDYVIQYNNIHQGTFDILKKLTRGAQEMFVLGQVVGLNQGIPTDLSGIITKAGLLEYALYDAYENMLEPPKEIQTLDLSNDEFAERFLKDGDFRRQFIKEQGPLLHKIDLHRFAYDNNYREMCVDLFEPLKISFNILDVVDKCPHILSYVQKLATADQSDSLSYNYRQIKEIYKPITNIYNISKDQAIKAINKYIQDQNILDWQLQLGPFITLPTGIDTFNPDGIMNPEQTKDILPLQLGSDYTNATFRHWMETDFIPNLKRGFLNGEPININDNLFIKGLVNDVRTNVNSGNGPVVYTLKANMLPKTDHEKTILNSYIDSFEQLSGYMYTENGNNIPVQDLFIMYALVAHDGMLAENSLMPLFEQHQTSGLLDSLHSYITEVDENRELQSLEDFLDISAEALASDSQQRILDYLLFTRYAATKGSFSLYTYVFDEETNENVLARKKTKEERKRDKTKRKGFGNKKPILRPENMDINMFPKGQVNTNSIYSQRAFTAKDGKVIEYGITINKVDKSIDISSHLVEGLNGLEGLVQYIDGEYSFVINPDTIVQEYLDKKKNDEQCNIIP